MTWQQSGGGCGANALAAVASAQSLRAVPLDF